MEDADKALAQNRLSTKAIIAKVNPHIVVNMSCHIPPPKNENDITFKAEALYENQRHDNMITKGGGTL